MPRTALPMPVCRTINIPVLGMALFHFYYAMARSGFWAAAIWLVWLFCSLPRAAVADAPLPQIDFATQIQPILARRCYSCHGPGHDEGGLRLHKPEAAFQKLDSDKHAIVAGKPDSSELLRRISAEDADERMPPTGKPLSEAEVSLVRAWIEQGAKWEAHWAFQPIKPVEPPVVRQSDWVRNPIDAFILQKLEQAELSPVGEASKLAWIRRATFNTTGLPPSPAEIADFLADNSPQAHDRVIDRLLASPHYGEHAGRKWLDLVRYAETNSFERDGVKPNAWRYRDYVIRAFNSDKPYDRFIKEQLAGDELPDGGTEGIIAAGYYRLGLWDDEPADPEQARYDELDDMVSTTSQVFLGLTVGCARCHDHKIDPIPQKDYYAFLAFLHEIQPYGRRGDGNNYNQVAIQTEEQAEAQRLWLSEQERLGGEIRALELIALQKLPEVEKADKSEEEQLVRTRERIKDLLQPQEHHIYQTFRQQLEELKKKGPTTAQALSIVTYPAPPVTQVLLRGNPHTPGDAVEPQFLDVLGGGTPAVQSSAGGKTSGRRTALANWIASPENYTTARVMANRVWQQHFGRGIVRSANNFGNLGTPPTHPELLDFLAGELIHNGWRLKPLHKLIMSSQVYRLAYADHPVAVTRDPANELYWRYDMRRLSAEEVRDTMHVVTGEFNNQMFGPSFYPQIQAEVLAGQSVPGNGWGKSSAAEEARRSIYIHVKRSLITPLLSVFDFPETDSSCEGRFITTQPSQALAMFNGEFFHQRAAALAERVTREKPNDRAAQVATALGYALQRPADPADVDRGVALIGQLQEQHKLSDAEALKYYCLSVLNRNEAIYVE
ncbi:MAG: DUF1549 domain-containing protein [Pirellulales bacterium]|nr:DUF1549 domain-containing protein [Pirellulales bacterium]